MFLKTRNSPEFQKLKRTNFFIVSFVVLYFNPELYFYALMVSCGKL